MNHAELLGRLLPPGAYDLNEPNLAAELAAEGAALDAALESADRLLNEIDPATAYSTLNDWERVYGIAQQAVDLGLSIEQRQAAVAAKRRKRGVMSIQEFIQMAEIFGFPGATVTEFAPATCDSDCDAAMYSEADRFCWQMNLPVDGGMFISTCDSPCDAPIGSWGTGAIENAIRAERQAHTTVIFNYV